MEIEISEFSSFYVRGAGPGKGWFGTYGHISGRLDVEAGDGNGGRILVSEKHDLRTVDEAREEFTRIILDAENHLCPFCSTWGCDETCVEDNRSADAAGSPGYSHACGYHD